MQNIIYTIVERQTWASINSSL